MASKKPKIWGETKPHDGAVVNWGDPISNGLTAYWLLNSGGKVTDITSNCYGAVVGGVRGSVGQFGRTLDFDGTSGYVSLAANPQSGFTGNYTTSFWIFPTSYGMGFRPIYDRDSGVMECYISNGTNLITLHNRSGSIHYKFWTIPTISVWTNVTIVFSDTAWSVYYNGIPQTGFGEVGTTSPVASAGLMTLGLFTAAAGYYAGKMDNFRIYKRALNPNEVRRLYTEPFAGIVEPRLRLRSSPAGAAPSAAPFIYMGRFF